MALTQKQISDCCKYIRAIRNDGKQAYATAYFTWRRGNGFEPTESFGIGAMARQAVRMQIDSHLTLNAA